MLFKKDPNILLDINTMIDPYYLKQQKVKVYKTLQMPGEYILTFPGAYHGGFSTGINIGEAVNFVSRTWFDYGFKCQEIYRGTREKIPVLPIDWLIIENILNIDHARLEPETKIKLRDSFARIVKEERFNRDQIEKKMRTATEQVYEMLPNRDNVSEDYYQCKYCTDFAYLSMIHCKVHKINYCISHQILCQCPPQNVKVIYRYSSKELDQLERRVNDACKNTNTISAPAISKKPS